MIALLLLVGCGPRWTEVDALAPTFARVDTDGDGAVSQKEWDAVRFASPAFAEVDKDADGGITKAELLAAFLAKDPTSLSPHRPSAVGDQMRKQGKGKRAGAEKPEGGGSKPEGGGPGKPSGKGDGKAASKIEDQPADQRRLRSESQLVVRNVLLSLKEEVRAAAPNQPTPTDDAIKEAASGADLRTVEARAVLAELEAASDAVGLGFPPSLRAAALAQEPIVPTTKQEDLPPDKPRVQLGKDGNPMRRGGADGPNAPTGPRRPVGTP